MKNIAKDEPPYENCNISKEFTNPKIELSIENTPPPLPEKRKIGRPDNIYENVGYIQDCLRSLTDSENSFESPKDTKSINQENKGEHLFRSTISIIVGNKIDKEIPFSNVKEQLTLDLKEPVAVDQACHQNVGNDEQNEDDDDEEDGSFKSLYAKSLMDSYRHSNINSAQTSPIEEVSKLSNLKELTNGNLLNDVNGISLNKDGPKGSPYSNINHEVLGEPNSIEDLESKIVDLTERMNHKDHEIKKLKQEVLALKLDCNHSRSEDGSSLLAPNIQSEKLVIPLSSNWSANNIHTPPTQSHQSKTDLDSLTLQQHITSLATQLEKAESSRHTYESATKQLVTFLQTINSTLTGTQSSALNQVPYDPNKTDPDKTLEILTNLENVLRSGRKSKRYSIPNENLIKLNSAPYNYIKDGSYLSNIHNGIKDSPMKEINDKSLDVTIEQDRSESDLEDSSFTREKLFTHTNGNGSIHHNAFNSSSTPISSVHNASREKTRRRDSHTRRDAKNVKKESQRRRTIPLKFWSTSKSELKRSESVSTLPINGKITPSVNRAVSTHCLASPDLQVEKNPSNEEGYCETVVSNRLLSSKAKNFFCSLKNIFKHDEDQKGNRIQESRSSSSVHLKLAPTPVSKSKIKSNQCADSPKSLTPAKCKKANSLRSESKYNRTTNQNSIFYVECSTVDVTDDCTDEVDASHLPADVNECEPVTKFPADECVIDATVETKDENEPVKDVDTSKHNGDVSVASDNVLYIETYRESGNDDANVDLVGMSGPQEMSMGLSLDHPLNGKDGINGLDEVSCGVGLSDDTSTGGGIPICTSISDKCTNNDTKSGDGINRTCTSTNFNVKCLNNNYSSPVSSISFKANPEWWWRISRSTYRKPGSRLVFV